MAMQFDRFLVDLCDMLCTACAHPSCLAPCLCAGEPPPNFSFEQATPTLQVQGIVHVLLLMLKIDREVACLTLVVPALHPAVGAERAVGEVELQRTLSV